MEHNRCCYLKISESVNKGWECPKCGRVFAPHVTMCLYCGDNTFSPKPTIYGWEITCSQGEIITDSKKIEDILDEIDE